MHARHQNEYNEGINIMRFICRFNVYFARNQRKCSQNGEDGNLKFKFLRHMIYHLIGHMHEILNRMVYFLSFKRIFLA